MRILITSGGTKVPIDGVRDITNMSNGTFGSKIAYEALETGAEVVFFRAKRSKTPFSAKFDFYNNRDWSGEINRLADLHNFAEKHRDRYKEVGFRNFSDYSAPLQYLILQEEPDIVILAAAVSDFLAADVVKGKIQSKGDHRIELEEAPKVISLVKVTNPDVFLVGFKLLMGSTQNELLDAAWKSLKDNSCDLVVANDLADIKANAHKLFLVSMGKGGTQICEPYQTPDRFLHDPNYLARQVVERSIEEWKIKSSSESPVA